MINGMQFPKMYKTSTFSLVLSLPEAKVKAHGISSGTKKKVILSA